MHPQPQPKTVLPPPKLYRDQDLAPRELRPPLTSFSRYWPRMSVSLSSVTLHFPLWATSKITCHMLEFPPCPGQLKESPPPLTCHPPTCHMQSFLPGSC